MRILLVEDDPALRTTLTIGLRAEGHTVVPAADGRTALDALREDDPDLVVLDLGLPDVLGLDVLTSLRTWSRIPVLVLSARADSRDKVGALDAGADDYVTKPCGIEELHARIRAAARRSEVVAAPFEVDGLVVDLAERRVVRDGHDVRLTRTEWALLAELLRTPGRLVPHRDLLVAVWGPGHERRTDYLRTYVATLRRKLERDPSRPTRLITEPGLGHRFLVDPEPGPDR